MASDIFAWWHRCVCAFVLLVAGFNPPPATAQAQQAPVKPANEKHEIQAIPLKSISAEQAGQMLNQLLPQEVNSRLHLAADFSANTVIVAGTPEDCALIKSYLQTLDVARPAAPAREERFQIIPLGHIAPDEVFEKSLRAVFPATGGKFVVDPMRSAVIVSGDDATIRLVNDFVRRLEQTQPERASKEMRLRVIWLASGLEGKIPPVPNDIKKVTDELAALGVEGLKMVSQSVLNVRTGNAFEAVGRTLSMDMPCTLNIGGTVTERPENAVALDLTLTAAEDLPVQREGQPQATNTRQLCYLTPQIRAQIGQAVVLGVTPTGSTTSVFVIQVLPKGNSEGGARP